MHEPNDDLIFYCKGKEALAYGKMSDDGKSFIVLTGSKVVHQVAPSFETDSHFKTYYENRKRMMEDGTIADFAFTKDVVFRSASAASAVVLGKPSNGRKDWKLEDGRTLGDTL